MSLILPVTQLAIWLGFNKLLCVISLLILNGFTTPLIVYDVEDVGQEQ